MASIQIEERIIVADPNPDVHEFEKSLASRFGQMLTWAQELYGERDMSYTIVGFEFVLAGPYIYHLNGEHLKMVIIHLPIKYKDDLVQCLFMLSHESLHCLSPIRGLPATRLEEGLAQEFSRIYMERLGHGSNWYSHGEKYNSAAEDVQKLLNIDPNIIKNIRKHQPIISRITKDDIMKYLNPDLYELATKLTEPFD